MRVVIDTNIVFSSLLNAEGTIGDLIFNSFDKFEFFSPEFILAEIAKYKSKLLKASSMNEEQLKDAHDLIFRKIQLISNEAISPENWTKAYDLVKDLDEKDTPFLATALSLDAILWTGDKELTVGLKKVGFKDVYNTQELLSIR